MIKSSRNIHIVFFQERKYLMKKFTYSLSEDDIITIVNALTVMVTVLPDSDLVSPESVDQALYYGEQAVKTLSTLNTRVSNNQLAAIHLALQIADGIISGDIPADEDSKKKCRNCLFTIRKLLSVFNDYFEG